MDFPIDSANIPAYNALKCKKIIPEEGLPPAMTQSNKAPETKPAKGGEAKDTETPAPAPVPPEEIGGPKGPEPTRYGDWEVGGRCSDF